MRETLIKRGFSEWVTLIPSNVLALLNITSLTKISLVPLLLRFLPPCLSDWDLVDVEVGLLNWDILGSFIKILKNRIVNRYCSQTTFQYSSTIIYHFCSVEIRQKQKKRILLTPRLRGVRSRIHSLTCTFVQNSSFILLFVRRVVSLYVISL